MLARRWGRLAWAGGAAFALLVACSSKVQDGASCDKGSDCESGRCGAGSCDGADCTCEGADCRSRASCLEGWLCTRGGAVTDDAIPRCRKQCTVAGSCTSDKHCDNGVCKDGAEPFVLAWLNIPRTTACAARVPCEYKVRPSDGTSVDKYTWSFGDAPPVETKDPSTSFTYQVGGTYAVLVRARATTGAVAELHTSEVLCQGAVGDACDTTVTVCCQGSCVADICK